MYDILVLFNQRFILLHSCISVNLDYMLVNIEIEWIFVCNKYLIIRIVSCGDLLVYNCIVNIVVPA